MLTSVLRYVASWAARLGERAAGWRPRRVVVCLAVAVMVCLGAGCGAGSPSAAGGVPHSDAGSFACGVHARPLGPKDGAWLGVSIDWAHDTLSRYAERLGHHPAVAVTFADMPLRAVDVTNVSAAVGLARAQGSVLLLTLEPFQGLSAVDAPAIGALVASLSRWTKEGVPIVVRYAHEMNGSWYPWGQQPGAYVRSFDEVAAAVHRHVPGAAMMWAPSYGGGYPFTGGRYAAKPGSPDAAALDTSGNGALDKSDDPYAPYYPGDAAVDWVGMSLYHWGTKYPWGTNEVPQPGKLVDQLRGRYQGPGVDETIVPDFYQVYGVQHRKPVAIAETAALYTPGGSGADELAVKREWIDQVLSPTLVARLPQLKMVNWFEWRKYEPETGGIVDWRATTPGPVQRQFRASLPDWARFGKPHPAGCAPNSAGS